MDGLQWKILLKWMIGGTHILGNLHIMGVINKSIVGGGPPCKSIIGTT